MKIGIHNSKIGFHSWWIDYCKSNSIAYKLVDCYANDIIDQLKDCDAFMWHFNQGNPKDIVFAKQLMFSLEQAGKKVFPNFNTAWHFDDKLGQKYLLESLEIPFIPTYAFYEKEKAVAWAKSATYPKVFKLRGGAGAKNVRLVRSYREAQHLITKAFNSGFSNYDAWGNLKERIRKYQKGLMDAQQVLKGIVRIAMPPAYSKVGGKEQGYIYFQEFIPDNDFDIRVIVIDNKAFAIKRMVRENDFRASGSGRIEYSRDLFDLDTIQLAFSATEKLNAQCVAFDFVYHHEQALIIEISYGFSVAGYHDCPGYWSKNLQWHEGSFNPYGWMVNSVLPKNSDEVG